LGLRNPRKKERKKEYRIKERKEKKTKLKQTNKNEERGCCGHLKSMSVLKIKTMHDVV